MLTMFVASMATVLFLLEESTMQMACLILFYYLMNILYCTWLKHKALIDVFIIALGFVLRVVAGGLLRVLCFHNGSS